MLANPLPANPSLERLPKQAKQLRDRVRAGLKGATSVTRR